MMDPCRGCSERGDIDSCMARACLPRDAGPFAWLVETLQTERLEGIRMAAHEAEKSRHLMLEAKALRGLLGRA